MHNDFVYLICTTNPQYDVWRAEYKKKLYLSLNLM